MSEKVKVVIEISGGVLQAVHSGIDLDVVLIDHDGIDAGQPGADSFSDGFPLADFMAASSTRQQGVA